METDMSTLNLPEPVAAYFQADLHGAKAVARCFTTDGWVSDERHTHTGPDAIEAWKAATSEEYAYTAEPLSIEQRDRKYIVTSRVTGDFPGSPVVLRYTFLLERGKVASLEIAP
jgi:hypothetical protein